MVGQFQIQHDARIAALEQMHGGTFEDPAPRSAKTLVLIVASDGRTFSSTQAAAKVFGVSAARIGQAIYRGQAIGAGRGRWRGGVRFTREVLCG